MTFNKPRVVLFGASSFGRIVCPIIRELFEIIAYSDNNGTLHHTEINGVPVIPPAQLAEFCLQNEAIVIITSKFFEEIRCQLASANIPMLCADNAVVINTGRYVAALQKEKRFSVVSASLPRLKNGGVYLCS